MRAPGQAGNVLRLHHDYPDNRDAWDIDIFASETNEEINALALMDVIEDDPLMIGVRVVRRFGRSRLSPRIWLHAASTRLDFETEACWHEDHRLLRVAFPVNVRALWGTYETRSGHVERPTHRNTSWDLRAEQPAPGRSDDCPRRKPPGAGKFFSVDQPDVAIDTVKKAEREDALIVRLYEAHGSRDWTLLQTALPVRQGFTADLLERTLQPLELARWHRELRGDLAPVLRTRRSAGLMDV